MNIKTKLLLLLVTLLLSFSCNSIKELKISISKTEWGVADGEKVWLFKLTNKKGMEVKITNFGATITSVKVTDKNGIFDDVVIGFDDLKTYQSEHIYCGSIVGRYGNRIAKGKFMLNNKEYSLAANNGPNHLHGGNKGFDKQVWNIGKVFSSDDSTGVELTYLSKDMEEGYPGNLIIKVYYTLNNENEIKIRYYANTDKPTVLNPTNHSYFNLSGFKESVLNHEVTINSDSVTPVDTTLIPTGSLLCTGNTPFDFNTSHKIGERINLVPGGYDINYKLRKIGHELSLAAEVYESASGRILQVYTTEPGIQFYSGNFLDGTFTGHMGINYKKYYGFCLETQHFPDSPNHPNFPGVILNPGQTYSQLTIFKFSVKQ